MWELWKGLFFFPTCLLLNSWIKGFVTEKKKVKELQVLGQCSSSENLIFSTFAFADLEELLPNFEQFLDDLSSVKLTSDLERRVKTYKQRIKSHIEQHSNQPGTVPPKVPG